MVPYSLEAVIYGDGAAADVTAHSSCMPLAYGGRPRAAQRLYRSGQCRVIIGSEC